MLKIIAAHKRLEFFSLTKQALGVEPPKAKEKCPLWEQLGCSVGCGAGQCAPPSDALSIDLLWNYFSP